MSKTDTTVSQIHALIKQVRNEALLDACGAICPECAKGNGVLTNEDYPNFFHVVGRQGVVDCPATSIRKLI